MTSPGTASTRTPSNARSAPQGRRPAPEYDDDWEDERRNAEPWDPDLLDDEPDPEPGDFWIDDDEDEE
jgi:hypothetical protein